MKGKSYTEMISLRLSFDSSVVRRISPKALVVLGGKISFLHNRFNLVDI